MPPRSLFRGFCGPFGFNDQNPPGRRDFSGHSFSIRYINRVMPDGIDKSFRSVARKPGKRRPAGSQLRIFPFSMEYTYFFKGLLAGFIICVPFGPIGLLCVMRTLTDGKLAGIAAVLGTSVMDAVYCAIAGLGISYISNFLSHERTALRVAGGAILVAVGIKIYFTHPAQKGPEAKGHGLVAAFGSSFLLMSTNPMAILVFTATFSALGIGGLEDAYNATAILVAGVFVGSALWAPILVAGVSFFNPQLTLSQLRLASRTAGVILFGFGIVSIIWAFC